MNYAWSFRAFRLFGTDVHIHWSLPAFFLYYLLRAGQHGYSLEVTLLWVLLPMLLLFGSVVCHEFGHVFAARYYGQHTGRMILTPLGGMVLVAQGDTPTSELVVAAAGPAVNVALAILALPLYFVVGGHFALELILPIGGHELLGQLWGSGRIPATIAADFIQTNIALFLFNMLLMAYPLDGGRVLMSVIWRYRGFRAALQLSCEIARFAAVALGAWALFSSNFSLGLIAALVFMQATTTLKNAPHLAEPGGGYFGAYQQAVRQGRGGAAKPRSNPLERWLRGREERRTKALLRKAERKGLNALSDEERAHLKRRRERLN